MFERFLENSINSEKVKDITDVNINQYKKNAPDSLINLWEEAGFGIYCDGLFRIIPPSDYQDIVDNIYDRDYNIASIPFLTTAFGDIFAYIKNEQFGNHVVFFNMRYGTYQIFTDNLNLLFNVFLLKVDSLEFRYKLGLYQQVKKMLGIPKYDECYAYVPALVLGGEDKVKNIQITKALPYIDIITQSIDEFKRFEAR